MLLLAAPWTLPGANDGLLDRATLKGLNAVNVVIDPIASPELQRAGVTDASLKSQVEQRLKAARVAVDGGAVEFLGLRVSFAQASRSSAAVGLSLGLYQQVQLTRDRNIRTATETWGTTSLQLLALKGIKQGIVECVNELVDRFTAAYLRANSAPGQGTPVKGGSTVPGR